MGMINKRRQSGTRWGRETQMSDWDGAFVLATRNAAAQACKQAGIDNSHEQLSLSEVHDSCSITERVTREAVFMADDDRVVFDVLDGRCNPGGVPSQGVAAISILGLA